MWNDLPYTVFDTGTLDGFKGVVNRCLLPELCCLQFSVEQVLVGFGKQFINNCVFPAWACTVGLNNNNNNNHQGAKNMKNKVKMFFSMATENAELVHKCCPQILLMVPVRMKLHKVKQNRKRKRIYKEGAK